MYIAIRITTSSEKTDTDIVLKTLKNKSNLVLLPTHASMQSGKIQILDTETTIPDIPTVPITELSMALGYAVKSRINIQIRTNDNNNINSKDKCLLLAST